MRAYGISNAPHSSPAHVFVCNYGDMFIRVVLFQHFGVYLATETLSLLLLFPYTHSRTYESVCVCMCGHV